MRIRLVLLLGAVLSYFLSFSQINTYTTNRTSTEITPSTIATKWFNGTDSSNLGVGFSANFQVTTGTNNTALGYLTMTANSQGLANTAIGSSALKSIVGLGGTTGSFNTAIGFEAMENSTTSFSNVAIGTKSLNDNLVSDMNVAIGEESMRRNTYGRANTAVGLRSLYGNTSDSMNVAVGNFALENPINSGTGSNNVAIGYAAMASGGQNSVAIGNEAGADAFQENSVSIGNYSQQRTGSNVAIGDSVLYIGSTPSRNVAIGQAAMKNANTLLVTLNPDLAPQENVAVGQDALRSVGGRRNIAIGNSALKNATLNWENVAIGQESMINFGSSLKGGNTAFGDYTLPDLTSGDSNTVFGYSAGKGLTTGSNNTLIGNEITINIPTSTNLTVIGSGITTGGSNRVEIGNASVTSIGGYAAFTNFSDYRLKENISYDYQLGLDFILKLQTARYHYSNDRNKLIRDGLIAQDLVKVLDQQGCSFSGLQKNENGFYSISYESLVVPLVKAHQELAQELEDLEEAMQYELERNKELRKVLTKIDDMP